MSLGEIELPYTVVKARLKGEGVVVEAREAVIEVSEPPTHGGISGNFNPLDLLLASLASCEAFLYARVLEALYGDEATGIVVKAGGRFELEEGLREVRLEITVKGITREQAEKAWNIAKKYCPIYNTLRKAVDMEEKLEAS